MLELEINLSGKFRAEFDLAWRAAVDSTIGLTAA